MNAEAALLAAARASVLGWAYVTERGNYLAPRHLVVLEQKLRALAERRIKGLIVEMPPRHGKSKTATEKFIGWYLGTNPNHRAGIITYGQDLADDFGRAIRDNVDEYGEAVFGTGIRVSDSSSAANRWHLAAPHTGGLNAVGISGTLTGRGFDLLVIDDPIKNQVEALSATYRERIWGLWDSTASTRLQPGGVVLVIQTRWHEDDLAGRLQRDLPDDWEVLRLPAMAEEDDPLGRALDEPLWPEFWSREWYEETRARRGSYVWNALYQQRPVAADGNMVRRSWLRFWTTLDTVDRVDMNGRRFARLPEKWDRQYQSWDLTFKDTKGSDYVVGGVLGQVGADRFLLHGVRDRLDYPGTRSAIATVSEVWPHARAKLVEDKANGPAIIADLGRTLEGIIAVNPQGGKHARLAAASPIIEAGNLWLPDPAMPGFEWVHDWIAEMLAFPNAPHDDVVDMLSQALVWGERDTTPSAASGLLGGGGVGPDPAALRAADRRARREAAYWGDDEGDDEDDEPLIA